MQGYPSPVTNDLQADSSSLLGVTAKIPPIQHEDVRERIAAVIPPRSVSWRQRIFWWVLLRVLHSRLGQRWVAKRYGG
ncbi:MAG: hypothetical protein EBR00_04775 [Gammaproteobacteria bacterium]|nr:hypothetical protein [Gammaproteobacteria bacterium]